MPVKEPKNPLREKVRGALDRLLSRATSPAVVSPKAAHGSYPSAGGGQFNAGGGTNGGVNRLRFGAPAAPGNIDAHLDARTLDLVRRDSRELARINPAARGAIKRMVTSLVGAGFTLSADTTDEAWNTQVQDWWEKRGARGGLDSRGRRSFDELLSVWMAQPAIDGDGLLVLLDNGRTQYVEGDRIGTPYDKISDDRIRSGVEFEFPGAGGVPVAYWICPERQLAGSVIRSDKYVRVPAERCVFLANPFFPWANNTRGEPIFAAVVGWFEQLNRYITAEVTKAELAAYLALVITTENPADFGAMLAEMAQQDITAQGGDASDSQERSGAEHQVWGPGAVLNMAPGEKAEVASAGNTPNQQADPFVRMVLRLIGADVGLPVSMWLLDASQENFHGFKSSQANTYRGFLSATKWLMGVASVVFEWALVRDIAAGVLTPPEGLLEEGGFLRHSWTPDPMPSPDEKGEIEGLALGYKERMWPISYAHQRLGFRTADVFRKIKAENDEMEELGISPAPAQGAAVAPAPGPQKPGEPEKPGKSDAEGAEADAETDAETDTEGAKTAEV